MRLFPAADLHDLLTPGMEFATGRRIQQTADDPFNRVEEFLFFLPFGDRFHQSLGIRV
jgi:hypothetical protein